MRSFIKPLILLSLMVPTGSAFAEDTLESSDETEENAPAIPEGAITKYPPIEYGSGGNQSGVFIGLGLGFGQVRTPEPGSTPGLATLFNIEPGYMMGRGSWKRVEMSMQFLSGVLTIDNKKGRGGDGTFSIGLGALARLGVGYSLGHSMQGVWRIGVGPAMAKAKFKDEGITGSADNLTGFMYQLGHTLVVPMTNTFDVTGGLTYSQVQFNVNEVSVNGTDVDFDQSFFLSIPQIELGMRLKL